MYSEALKIQGRNRSSALRTALAVRKEKNRILDLYVKNETKFTGGETLDVEFSLPTRPHLESFARLLGIDISGLPLIEALRIAEISVSGIISELERLKKKDAKLRLPSPQTEDARKEPPSVE